MLPGVSRTARWGGLRAFRRRSFGLHGDSPSWDLIPLTCLSVVPTPEDLLVHGASLPLEDLASYDWEFLIPWLCHRFRGHCFPDVYATAGVQGQSPPSCQAARPVGLSCESHRLRSSLALPSPIALGQEARKGPRPRRAHAAEITGPRQSGVRNPCEKRGAGLQHEYPECFVCSHKHIAFLDLILFILIGS